MQFSKTSFAILLAILFVLPAVIYKLTWIVQARSATGTMCFQGKSLNGQFPSEYPVIKFTSTGKDTVFFNGAEGVEFKKGEQVPILYSSNNPAGAMVNSFQGMWIDATIYASIPLVMLLILFLHPGIIPKHSKIVIGKKPFIKLIE